MKNYFIKEKFNDVTVYSDRHKSYQAFFEDNGVKYENFVSSHHVSFMNHDVHNQTVNAYIRGFKTLVNEYMRGVSTKYLPFYIKWYQFAVNTRNHVAKMNELKFNIADKICDNVIEDKFGFELYRQAEVSFVRFLKNNGRSNYGDCKNHFYADKIAA
jgi:hypothetical protein